MAQYIIIFMIQIQPKEAKEFFLEEQVTYGGDLGLQWLARIADWSHFHHVLTQDPSPGRFRGDEGHHVGEL